MLMSVSRRQLAKRIAQVGLTLGLAGCGHLHHPSIAAEPFCAPPWDGAGDAPTTWRIAGRAEHDSAVALDAAAHALSGTWEMLTVATEGVNETQPERWKLRLVVADSASQNPCFIAGCRLTTVHIVAVGAPLGASPFDSAAVTKAKQQPNRVAARYDRKTNHVTLDFGPPMLDAGTFYEMTEVSDSTIAGRWVDGSYLLFSVRRGDVTTLEHPQGFFCGRRIHGRSN